MYLELDVSQKYTCTRFGRMLQRNRWNRQGITQKNVNLLVFVVAGAAAFTLPESTYTLTPGDVLLIPAGMSYSAATDDLCEYYFFHFDGVLTCRDAVRSYPPMERDFSFELPQVADSTITLEQKTTLAENYAKAYRYVTNCADLHATGSFVDRLAIDAELARLLLLLARFPERQSRQGTYPLVLERMLEYIRKNLTQPLSTAELCRHCDISASYAARLFKRHLNTTMTQYITDQKLSYAAELMASTRMNISQIAEYLGFCDVFYFSRRFKQKYGRSPTQMF